MSFRKIPLLFQKITIGDSPIKLISRFGTLKNNLKQLNLFYQKHNSNSFPLSLSSQKDLGGVTRYENEKLRSSMSVGSPNSLKSPTDSKQFDSSHMNGQRGKLNGDLDEPVPVQRKSTMKKLVGGVAVLPTLSKPIGRDDEKENKTSPVFYDHEPGRRTLPEQVRPVLLIQKLFDYETVLIQKLFDLETVSVLLFLQENVNWNHEPLGRIAIKLIEFSLFFFLI